jgi:hypothetical protein
MHLELAGLVEFPIRLSSFRGFPRLTRVAAKVRWMLLFEDPINASIALLKTTPRTWLNPGERIAVRRAPLGSSQQRLSFEVVSQLGEQTPTVAANISLDEQPAAAAQAPASTRDTGGGGGAALDVPPAALSITLRVPRPWRIASVMLNEKIWNDFYAVKELVNLPALDANKGTIRLLVHYSKVLSSVAVKADDEENLGNYTTTPIARVHGGGACSDDTDCQLNGRCTNGRCRCLPAWESANCSLLATRPTPGPAHGMANTSSWGGRSLLWEKDNQYHVSLMVTIRRCFS